MFSAVAEPDPLELLDVLQLAGLHAGLLAQPLECRGFVSPAELLADGPILRLVPGVADLHDALALLQGGEPLAPAAPALADVRPLHLTTVSPQ